MLLFVNSAGSACPNVAKRFEKAFCLFPTVLVDIICFVPEVTKERHKEREGLNLYACI